VRYILDLPREALRYGDRRGSTEIPKKAKHRADAVPHWAERSSEWKPALCTKIDDDTSVSVC
jgi:hypothetical protein